MNRKQSNTGGAPDELGGLFLSRCWQLCYSAEKDILQRLLNTSHSIYPHILAVFTYSRHVFKDDNSGIVFLGGNMLIYYPLNNTIKCSDPSEDGRSL